MARDFLTAQHPIYEAQAEEWARNERRLRGGADVRAELVRFDWERDGGDHFKMRQLMATYVNFPDIHATTIMGHLLGKAPQPTAGLDFGGLGEVGQRGRFTGSLGERLYYNVDGVGNDGSQWDNWWMTTARNAMATGHRWIYVEHPQEAPVTLQRQLAGLHPYLVEFSPVDVPLWHIRRGRLEFAVVLLSEERPRLEGGKLTGMSANDSDFLLLVRRGFTGLDDEGYQFSVGGWFRFDKDRRLQGFGSWDMTGGEIPMFPIFYERQKSTREAGSVKASLSLSRSGTADLGQVAISYMNLASAADFDAWDAAKSDKYLLGIHPDDWDLVRRWEESGSTVKPVPTNRDTGQVPQIVDASTGAVTAEVFGARLDRKVEEAQKLSQHEAASTPDSSGRSKMAGFGEFKAPRLVLQASNLEQAQNTALYFLERRAGIPNPTASVIWTRDFELEPVTDSIREAFELERVAGLRSQLMGANMMVQYLRRKGLLTDDAEAQTVLEEYLASADRRDTAAAAEDDLFAELGG